MKAVLISIQPKWCELIASGKKTVEVRKTRPKLLTPFKCYIYCTKGRGDCLWRWNGVWYDTQDPNHRPNRLDGKVIGEFVCERILKFPHDPYDSAFRQTADLSCVVIGGLSEYLGHNKFGYAWHISELVIYEKSRELREFVKYRADWGYHAGIAALTGLDCNEYITRPPQSWCYVEDTEWFLSNSC